jgi:Cu2+-exporting ATPase
MSAPCFHCGLPVPSGAAFPIRYRERAEPACCAGCQAVAQTIVDAGLGDYYAQRSEEARKAEPLPVELREQIGLYDSAALQKSFVRIEDGNAREAALMLEGITCAACVWLNERQLARLPGVLAVDINYTTHRARVRWDNSALKLSQILEAVAAIGYRAHPYDAARQEELAQKERKRALNRLWAAGLSMMQVMMYAVPIYLAPNGEIEPQYLWMLHWASFLLTLPVLLYSAVPFYQGSWRDLKAGRLGMDLPVALGVLVSFGASTVALLRHIEHGIYFDSVSMFVFLLLGGRYLEGIARRKTGEATESLVKLIPAFAHRITGWPQQRDTHEAAVAELQSGDVLLIKPGETVPVDGEVLEGNSALNEAFLTGESRPIAKQPGDTVVAGSVNTQSPLTIRTSHTGENTRLASIVRLLDQALAEKPRLAEIANRFAGGFVGLLLLASLATFLVWQHIDPQRALWVTVALLVISCPCALSLATPAALTAATGHLATLGLLTARGHAIETMAQISDVVFDKTGTLTDGSFRLLARRDFALLGAPDALALAQALETGSEHPIARALLSAPSTENVTASDIRNVPGCGVEGEVAGLHWRLGKLDFVQELAGPTPELAGWHEHATLIGLGSAQGWLALFALGDAPRADAAELVRELKTRGHAVHLLSGDSHGAVAGLAATFGIEHWQAGATPEQKLAYVGALQAQGKRVLMVGDGVNDAPVLARADVSLAMGGGTDVARASGDLVLVNDTLAALPKALALAQKTLRVIRQNLWWAVVYNLVALPLAMSGRVTPWLASLGMALSSLLVVGNALRLIERKR